MKSFAYGSLGVLALMVAFHLGSVTASTSMVDHMSGGIVAASFASTSDLLLLDENGTAWQVCQDIGWLENPSGSTPLPVPLAELKLWSRHGLVTFDDQVWLFNLSTHEWIDMGQWPGSSSATEYRSWGSIKAEYR